MSDALTTNQAFDDYAAEFGWEYDNGGSFAGEYWEWYSREEPTLKLLRQGPDRVALVRFGGSEPVEIWRGRIGTRAEFDGLLELIAGLS